MNKQKLSLSTENGAASFGEIESCTFIDLPPFCNPMLENMSLLLICLFLSLSHTSVVEIYEADPTSTGIGCGVSLPEAVIYMIKSLE